MKRTLISLLGLLAVLAAAQANAAERDTHEPNNAPAQATRAESGKTLRAAIDPAKDVDVFAVDVPKPGYGMIEVMVRDVPANIAPKIELLDPEQKAVTEQRRPRGTSLFHRQLVEKPGRYYIALSDASGAQASPNTMAVTITFRPVDRSFEPNETPEQATPLAFGKPVRTAIFPEGDIDVYKLTVPAPGYGLLTVRLTGDERLPNLSQTDAEGQPVYGAASRQIGNEGVMVLTTRQAGDIFLRVSGTGGYGYGARQGQPYELAAEYQAAGGAGEPNEDAKTATPVKLGEPVSGRFFPADDKDFYRIDVPRPGLGIIEVVVTEVAEPICPQIQLFDANQKPLGGLQRGFGSDLRFRYPVRDSGAYTLMLQAGSYGEDGRWSQGSSSQSEQPYKMVARFIPVNDPSEPNDNHDTARAIEVGQAVQATLFPRSDVDFYKFTLPATQRGVLRIEADGFNDMFAPILRLHNAAKRVIKSVQVDRNQPAVLTEFLREGGDFYVEVRDRNYNTASAEPYTLKVAFQAAPGTEPNDKIEEATAIRFGQEHEAALFPGNDADFFKVDIAQAGPVRIQVGDFAEHIQPRVTLFGPDKKRMLSVSRHTARVMLDADITAPGTYYVQVQPNSFRHPVRDWIGTQDQFDMAPYRIRVAAPPAPAGAAEVEPNNTLAAAQTLRSGQAVLGKLDTNGDRDWFRIDLNKPSMLDVDLSIAPDKLDPQIVVYRLPQPAGAAKRVLYLHGPRGEFNLNNHLHEVEFTRLEHNTPEAKAALGNPDEMAKYHAIVADCLHNPDHLELNSPRVQANIQGYVQGGGRFLLLSPFTGAKLFGVEMKEAGRWHANLAVAPPTPHPLLRDAGGSLRGWSHYDSIGYFDAWKEAGFEPLVARTSDPEKHALTLAKSIGKGYLILDAQMLSYDPNWPRSSWKLRALMGLPPAEMLAHINATQLPDGQPDLKRPEFARLAVREPGTVYVGVMDTRPDRSGPDPYALTLTVTPLEVPDAGGADLFTAQPLANDAEVALALARAGEPAWFKVEAAKLGELRAALSQVPPDADPQLRLFEGLADPAKPARVLYLHGGRNDFNLDRSLPDIRWERLDANGEQAPAALLSLDAFRGYDAVVVDGLTRPDDFGLTRATVVQNIEAYVRQGGHFIVLSPMCKAALFGVELGETSQRQDTVREVYPVDPLFAGRSREHRVNGWPGAETHGYWLFKPDSGFTPAFVDRRDPARYAVTLIKRLGQGMIVLDAQMIGQDANTQAAAWKLYAYLGRTPAVRFLRTVDNSEATGLGGGESVAWDARPATYYLEVTNRVRWHGLRPMRLTLHATAPDRPLESDDSPETAKPAMLGQEMPASLYPSGDADWRLVTAPGRGALNIRLTDLPDNIDPVVHIRRRIETKNPVQVLYLEGDPANEIDPERYPGAAIRRIDAHQPEAATALDQLDRFQVVVLSAISDARQFGLNHKAAHDKLQRFVEGGGRCLVLHPAGASFALNHNAMGGRLESASSQYDDWTWHATHACDGYKVPGQRGTGWCSKAREPFPHTLTWSLGGAKPVDRAVLYNFATSDDRRVKDFELQISSDGQTFRSLGKYVASPTDERQEFRFKAATGSQVRIVITSNYGNDRETQFGELEFYGPDSAEGFFGVPLVAGGQNHSVAEVEPLHWLQSRRAEDRPNGWPGGDGNGWWADWRRLGFTMVVAEAGNVRARAVTLCKPMGKGWVVLESQPLTHPKNAAAASWKLNNILGTPDTVVLEAGRRQPETAADVVVEVPVLNRGDYLVRITDRTENDQYANRSERSLTFRATFKGEENDAEPNDTARQAASVEPGEVVTESIFPGGDADWYRVPVESDATLDILLDNVPSGIRPVVEVHRAPIKGRAVKVLYLAGHGDAALDQHAWGPAPVSFTRVDAGAPDAATVLQRLAGYDVVILDGLSDVSHFGMDQSESPGRIEAFAKAGGRFLLLAPRNLSMSLLAKASGASSEGSLESGTASSASALRLTDGEWQPKSNSGAWGNYYRQKTFPHWFVFRLGDTGATLDRVVVYNTALDDTQRVKELEVQAADQNRPEAFRSLGKFECRPVDDRQEFKFPATKARFVKLLIHSNHGHANNTQIGEIELYGPGRPENLLGVSFSPMHYGSGEFVAADAKHWLAAPPSDPAQGHIRAGRRGLFHRWADTGFQPVWVDKKAPNDLAATLCKPVGKGFIILDTHEWGRRTNDGTIEWPVWNMLGLEPTRVALASANWGIGRLGSDRIQVPVGPGLHYVRIRDAQPRNWSLEKFRLRISVVPIPRPFEPNDTPETATWLVSGRPVQTTIFPASDIDWFRIAVAKPGPVRVEVTDVPDPVAPAVEVFAASKPDQVIARANGTQGGSYGYPEMFVFQAPAAGVYHLKLSSGGRYGGSGQSTEPMTLTAWFDQAKTAVPPRLVAVVPGDSVIGVSSCPNLRLSFDRPLAKPSGADVVRLRGSQSGSVAVNLSYNPATYELTAVPKQDLAPGETVTVTAGTALAEVFGGRLAKEKTWSFTVMQADTGGRPVSVRIAVTPSPIGIGQAGLSVTPSRALRGAPEVTAKASNGAALPVGKFTQNARGQWVATLTVPAGTPSGPGTFSVRAVDTRNRAVTDISDGRQFLVDTAPPPAMPGLTAVTAAGGRARLTWARLEGVPDLGGYRLYRSAQNTNRRETATMVKAADGPDFLTWDDPTPKDAAWYYFITALDRAGNEGPPSPAVGVTTDRVAPTQAIAELSVRIETKPRIDIAWKATTDLEAIGYSVFRFKQGEPVPPLAEAKPLTELPRDRTTLQDFPPDGAYVYRVCARDHAGNLGPASPPVDIVLDTRQAEAQFTLSSKPPLLQGEHTVTFKLNEPLVGDLKIVLVMPDGQKRELKPTRQDDLSYTAKMTFVERDPEGWAHFNLDGEDRYGNRGIRLRTYNRIYLDTGPPKAWITTSPRSGRLGAGTVQVRIEFGEDVKDGATLFVVSGERKLPVPIQRNAHYSRRFDAQLTVPKDFPNGPAKFVLSATDRQGHTGGIILRGETFEVDTVPPEPPSNVTVQSGPNRALVVSWAPPTRKPVDFFRLYGAPQADVRPGKDTLLADTLRQTRTTHTPKADQVLWFAVTAVDHAGNESPISRIIKGEPDTTPPPPPTQLALRIEPDGRVRLTWTPPRTDEAVRYHIYRGTQPITAVTGLKPVQQTEAAFALDDPRQTATYYYLLTAVDEAGNQSTPVAAPALEFDIEPPTASVAVTPVPGTRSYSDAPYQWYRIGVLNAGEKAVTLTPSEPLAEPPTLRYRTRSMDTPREVTLTESGGGKWQGRLTVPARTDDGLLTFFFEGVDRKQNRGTAIPKGSGNKFWIDTTPPEAVASLRIESKPLGKVALQWQPPPGEGRDDATYAVYRSDKPFTSIDGLKPVAAKLDRFEYADEPPKDGTYHYTVVATDLGGNLGRVYPAIAAVSDGTPPAAPTGLKAEVRGHLFLSWQAPEATGLVYRVLRGGEVVAEGLREPQWSDAPEDDGNYAYRVVALDAAGNPSTPSQPVAVPFTNTLPTAVIEIEPPSPVRSTFRVTCTSSRPLKGAPELFLHFANGTPQRIATEKRDAEGKQWVGSVQVGPDTPNGPAKFTFLGISSDGLRGQRIRRGAEIAIDTRPPSASFALTPGSPLRSGKVKLTIKPSEPLQETPKLSYTTMGAAARTIEIKPDGDHFVGEIEITEADKDGTAFFTFSAIDRAGNVGTAIHPKHFTVDNHPPKPPTQLAATTQKHGDIALTWTPPIYAATETRDDIAGYNIYASTERFQTVQGLEPLLARTVRLPASVRPPSDGLWYLAVTTVDTAGLESPPSNIVEARSLRAGPMPPRVTQSEAVPAGIRLVWEAPENAVAFGVMVQGPGERNRRRVADGLKDKAFTLPALLGGSYSFWLDADDALGHRSWPSAPVRVDFVQKTALASLTLPSETLGRGAHPIKMETTLPLVRAPKLRLIPKEGDPLDVAMTGAGRDWAGTLTVGTELPSGPARFEYEGVTLAEGQELTGRGLLSGGSVLLDFDAPTASVAFDESMPMRGRRVVLKGGPHRFTLHASKPLREPPRLTFTPRGRDAQTIDLTPTSETTWTAGLVVDQTIGDGSGLFEVALVDRQGNRGDEITEHRNVEIDTLPPNRITQIRAVALPGGKVRVEWIPPYFEDGKLDSEANTFYIYRGESELTDVTGLSPHRIVQRTLGFVDRPPSDRRYYYAVAALDRAGNAGAVSRSASVHVDKTPPGTPRELRVTQTDTGVVHLSWKEPEGEKPLFYNVYLAEHPIVTTQGMSPKNPGVTWTEIYGTPNANGTYYFAVTSVDASLNESKPCESVMIDYKAIAPIARFKIEPDIWLTEREYLVRLETSKPLVEPPSVVINSQHDRKYPIRFEGSGSRWQATLTIGKEHPEGTYGFIFRGKDAEGNTGDEILSGPLFHVDKTAPLPPGELKIEPDSKGTPGAVVLHWVTPKKANQQTEVPHFYNIYRSTQPIKTLQGMSPVHTFKVIYENIDDYHHTDMPPANGTYYYVVTSLDMARNESAPSNKFKVTVQSDSPRATLELFRLIDGQASPVATDEQGRPVVGGGKLRVVLRTTSPLRSAPKLAWHARREDDRLTPVAMTGRGAVWQGDFEMQRTFEEATTAFFKFEGLSEGGAKGTFIRQGDQFRIDTVGPVAEIIIPSAYKMKVHVQENKLVAPPVRGGQIKVELTADKDLAEAPELHYKLDDGPRIPIPMSGFGRNWYGFMDLPFSLSRQQGVFEYRGVDRAGNPSTRIAPRRYPYDTDDNFPPRKIASYATTGGEFITDTVAPEAPTEVETEMRKLGVAVIKWKAPAGDPMTYNLYRSLTPITSTEGMKPVKDTIYAPIIVDAPPVDANYFYAVTAVDLAGNEGPVSECKSVFIDTIKPELKIQAVPSGDDFVILLDEDMPPQLSLTINFPGRPSQQVELGGSSGELEEYKIRTIDGRPGIVLPQMAEFFNGRVEVIVHSPDPEGNIVEEKTEVEMKQIASATGGEVASLDEQVQLTIPPGLSPVIPKGPKEVKRVDGYEHLFFIQYANIPDEKPVIAEGESRRRDQVDPLPPGLEVVGRPYRIEMNLPPEEPLQLSGSATQADLSQLKELTAKLTMTIPTMYSDAVEDPEYLKTRLKVIKWVPARSDDEPGKWEYVPDIEVDVENKTIITPASEITTYVIVSERTPPSIWDMTPERGASITQVRPRIACRIVDKGTGVAVGAENRIVLSLNGRRIEEKFLTISKGDPTEVTVEYTPTEDLKPGLHTVGIYAEDVVENVANVKWQFTIDNHPPVIESVWPESGERLPVAQPVLQAVVSDEGGIDPTRTQLTINGESVPAAHVRLDEETGRLTCSWRTPLSSGRHAATLVVFDKAGLSTEKTWPFISDLEAPDLASILPAPGSTVDPAADRVELKLRDRFGSVQVLDLRVNGERVAAGRQGRRDGYVFDVKTGSLVYGTPKPFGTGEHHVAIVVADDLGNTREQSWQFTGKPGAPKPVAYDAVSEAPAPEAVAAQSEELRTTKLAFAQRLKTLDTETLRRHDPEIASQVRQWIREARTLEMAQRLGDSLAKYAEASAHLTQLQKRATQAELPPVEPEVQERFESARQRFTGADDYADRARIAQHKPEALKAVDAVVAEARKLEAARELDKSADAYARAATLLAEADKTASEVERLGDIAALKEQFDAAKAQYAALIRQANRELLAKHLPEALPAVEALAREAEALGTAEKYPEATAKFSAAAKQLGDANQRAGQLEATAAAKAEQARYDAAKKAYDAIAARADKALIRKHKPDDLAAAEQQAAQAAALAEQKKLTESTTAYEQATAELTAADKAAREIERLGTIAAARQQFDAAKAQYAALIRQANRELLAKHLPEALPAVEALAREAEALGTAEKYPEATAKFSAATKQLGDANQRAGQLETTATAKAEQARHDAVKKAYDAIAVRADKALIRKHKPDDLAAAEQQAAQAAALAEQKKLTESTTAYEQATATLTAADKAAREIERLGATAALKEQFNAAKRAFNDTIVKVDAVRIRKYVPDGLTSVSQIVSEAEKLAEAEKPVEGAAKYREAAKTLAEMDAKAAELEKAEQAPKKPSELDAARKRYTDAIAKANIALLLQHAAAEYQAAVVLARQAEEIAAAKLDDAAVAKYGEALAKLRSAEEQARKADVAPPAEARARFDAARKRCLELIEKVDAATVKQYAPDAWGAAMLLLQEANALGAEGRFDASAGKYLAALEQAKLAVDQARKKKAADPVVGFGEAKQRYVDAMAAIDQRAIQQRSPDVFAEVARLTTEAEVLARQRRHAEAAVRYDRAARLLLDADRDAKKPKPDGAQGDAVDKEIEAIHALAKQGNNREAIERLTDNLVALWKTHRKRDWAELLAFVQQCQKQYPGLQAVGRFRFGVLVGQLEGYVQQEKAWNTTRAKVDGMSGTAAQRRELETFIRQNYNGLYESDARKRLEGLKK